MTDNEIIKALECNYGTRGPEDCENCPFDGATCYMDVAEFALDLINRQKAEIERLKKENATLSELMTLTTL